MRIKDFQWDEGNCLHLELGHGITPDEAEEVFAHKPIYRKTKRDHYATFGPTRAGRYLTVVFQLNEGAVARVITAWDMRTAEIQYYKRKRMR